MADNPMFSDRLQTFRLKPSPINIKKPKRSGGAVPWFKSYAFLNKILELEYFLIAKQWKQKIHQNLSLGDRFVVFDAGMEKNFSLSGLKGESLEFSRG